MPVRGGRRCAGWEGIDPLLEHRRRRGCREGRGRVRGHRLQGAPGPPFPGERHPRQNQHGRGGQAGNQPPVRSGKRDRSPTSTSSRARTAPTRRVIEARSGKMPTTSVRRRISRLSRSLDQIWRQISLGKAVNARMSARAPSRCWATWGSLPVRASTTRSNWACTASASGWSYTECSSALTHGQELFGVTDIRFAA